MKSEKKITGTGFYALVFGLFLGLAILKFGNPVILDQKITPPVSPSEFWADAWPTHWGNWILLPLALMGAALGVHEPAALAGNTPALAAAVAVVRLAASFRHANRGWQSHRNDALSICRMPRLLFHRRTGFGTRARMALAAHRGAGGVCILPRSGNQPAAF